MTALAMLLVLCLFEGASLACPIAIRQLGPIDAVRSDLRRPIQRQGVREDWGKDDSWASVTPRLTQFVRLRGGRNYYGWTYPKQRALSIDAYGPDDNGWTYFSDEDPLTPECQLTGQIEWQLPKISVKQTRKEVRVIATAQRTVGDRTGCILGADQGVRKCPNLARTIVLLKQQLGARKLYFEQLD